MDPGIIQQSVYVNKTGQKKILVLCHCLLFFVLYILERKFNVNLIFVLPLLSH
jgi:hypothetical protein